VVVLKTLTGLSLTQSAITQSALRLGAGGWPFAHRRRSLLRFQERHRRVEERRRRARKIDLPDCICNITRDRASEYVLKLAANQLLQNNQAPPAKNSKSQNFRVMFPPV
jgi:hypothetical protein